MELGAFLLVINLLIGTVLVHLLRKQDVYHPESVRDMALATSVGGVASILLVYGVRFALGGLGVGSAPGILNFFLLTGPIEEISKLLGFLFFIRVFKVYLDEPVDAVLYMSCVALGFSLIENLLYALDAPMLLGIRSLTATPMHIVFSSMMALVYAAGVGRPGFAASVIKAVCAASLLHGLYDSLVISGLMGFWMLYVFLAFSLIWGRKLLGYALLNSPHRIPLASLAADPKRLTVKLCLNCGEEADHFELQGPGGSSLAEECQSCRQIVLTERKARSLLGHFLPHSRALAGKDSALTGRLDDVFEEWAEPGRGAHRSFVIAEAGPQVEALAEELRRSFESTAAFSFIFGTRPVLELDFRNLTRGDGIKAALFLLGAFSGAFLLASRLGV